MLSGFSEASLAILDGSSVAACVGDSGEFVGGDTGSENSVITSSSSAQKFAVRSHVPGGDAEHGHDLSSSMKSEADAALRRSCNQLQKRRSQLCVRVVSYQHVYRTLLSMYAPPSSRVCGRTRLLSNIIRGRGCLLAPNTKQHNIITPLGTVTLH